MHKIRKIIDTGLPENNTQALDKFKEIVRDSLDVSIMFLNIILKLKMKKLNCTKWFSWRFTVPIRESILFSYRPGNCYWFWFKKRIKITWHVLLIIVWAYKNDRATRFFWLKIRIIF